MIVVIDTRLRGNDKKTKRLIAFACQQETTRAIVIGKRAIFAKTPNA
jgi:hypothetical protein